MIVRLLEIACGAWKPRNAQFALNHEKQETEEALEKLTILANSLNAYVHPFAEDSQKSIHELVYHLELALRDIEDQNYAMCFETIVQVQDLLSQIAAILEQKTQESLFQHDNNFQNISQHFTNINNQLFDEITEFAKRDESAAKILSDYHSNKD